MLIADIGATNARFALLDGCGGERWMTLLCADYGSLEAAIEAFLAATGRPPGLVQAALAVAGPITGDAVALTNLAWRFSIQALRQRLALDRLEVINDFTAVALAVPWLRPEHRHPIGPAGEAVPGEAVPGETVAVLGPGSGLGVSGLVPDGRGGWRALAGEGGHVTLAAADDRESAVLAVLRGRLGHVSAESVLSGPGLVRLHHALAALDSRPERPISAAEITAGALAGTSAEATTTTSLFAAFLGTVAGNLALTLGARGGVFIAGGIVPRLAGWLEGSPFRHRFVDKGVQTGYLSRIPTTVVTHPAPAFLGLGALLSRAEP
jgi:glucokinase